MPSPDDKTTLDSDNILSDPDRVPENQLAVQVEQLDLKQPESADQEAQGGVLDPQLEDGKSDGEEEEEEEEEEEKHDGGADGEEQEEQKRNVNGSNESDKEGDDEEERWDDGRKNKFPVRPEAEDCAFYLKTGTCKFGSNCKFNHHPRRKLHVASKERVKDKEESKEKTGQVECKYFSTPGGCKYGKSCRYNHSKASSVLPAVELNFLGLPVRLGEKECPFYMRTGTCKFAANCKFNHPDPMAGADPPMEYGNGGSSLLQNASQFPVWSPSIMYSPTPVVSSPNAEWNGYQFSSNPQPQGQSMLPPAAYIMNSPTTNGSHIHTNQQQLMGVDKFPERPGQPECSYFLKTGDCKFKSSCKYHHPKDQVLKSPQVALSDMGLPLRPGQNICSYYSRYGICKFGPACKFDHSMQLAPCKFDHSMQLAPSELERQPSTENSLGEDDPTIRRQVKDRW